MKNLTAEERERAGEYQFVFDVPVVLAATLAEKADSGIKITRAYQENNRDILNSYVKETLPKIRTLVLELRNRHREQWFKTCKAYG